MKFAELAGNMWDDAGALVLEMVKKRGNTITTISEDEKAKWVKATEPVIDAWIKQVKDKGLDGGKLIEQATRPGRQVRQGLTARRRCSGSVHGGRQMQAAPLRRGGWDERRRRAAARGRRSSSACRAPSPCSAACCSLSVAAARRGQRARALASSARRSTATSSWCRWRPPSPSSPSCPTARRAAATSSSTPSRAGCRVRTNALIDAFWDLVYAGMMGLLTACLATGTHRALPQRPDHHAAAAHRLAGDRRLRRALPAAHLRRAGDGCQLDPGTHMSGLAVAALGFGVMLLLIAVRMPVGLSMLVVGAVGYIHLSSWPAFFAYMKTNPYHQFANYTLSVIPLFILMGAFAEKSGMSRDLFTAAEALVGHMRGGLAMAVISAPARPSAPSAARRSPPRPRSAARPCPSCGATSTRTALPPARSPSAARRHAHSALDHPGRLRHHHRAEHRQAVQGGADAGPAGRRVLLRRHPHRRAPKPGDRTRSGADRRRRAPAELASHLAGHRRARPRHRRHLRRRLHADRGRRRRRRRHAVDRPAAALARLDAASRKHDADGARPPA